MNDFQKIYQESIEGLPGFSLDASTVLDEVRHRKRVVKRRRQMFSSALVTCSLLLVCGIGSITTADYFRNRSMTDTQSRLAAGAEAGVTGIENGAETGIESGTEAGIREEAALLEAPVGGAENQEAAAAAPMSGEFMEEGSGQEEAGLQEKEEALLLEDTAEEDIRWYDTIEEFRSRESAALALPVIPQGEIEKLVIYVTAGTADREEVSFYQKMQDGKAVQIQTVRYEDSQSRDPAREYGAEAVKEREYTTQAGYTYRLVDTAGEIALNRGVHAAISVDHFEMYADFWGYTQEQVQNMLESMDLSVYCDK